MHMVTYYVKGFQASKSAFCMRKICFREWRGQLEVLCTRVSRIKPVVPAKPGSHWFVRVPLIPGSLLFHPRCIKKPSPCRLRALSLLC
jgi:hypothetical protein